MQYFGIFVPFDVVESKICVLSAAKIAYFRVFCPKYCHYCHNTATHNPLIVKEYCRVAVVAVFFLSVRACARERELLI